MRYTFAVGTLVLLTGFLTPTARAQDTPREVRGVWGTYIRLLRVNDATSAVAEQLADIGERVRFRDGKMRLPDEDNEVAFKTEFGEGTIDLTTPGKNGRKYLAIYRIEDGVLTIVINCGTARPASFTETGSNEITLLMRRPADAPDDDN